MIHCLHLVFVSLIPAHAPFCCRYGTAAATAAAAAYASGTTGVSTAFAQVREGLVAVVSHRMPRWHGAWWGAEQMLPFSAAEGRCACMDVTTVASALPPSPPHPLQALAAASGSGHAQAAAEAAAAAFSNGGFAR